MYIVLALATTWMEYGKLTTRLRFASHADVSYSASTSTHSTAPCSPVSLLGRDTSYRSGHGNHTTPRVSDFIQFHVLEN